MLGKLFKHEWKRIYKLECLLLIIMAVFTAIEAIMFFTPMTDFMRMSSSEFAKSEPITIFWIMAFMASIVACVMVIIGVTYGNIISIGMNFEKTMYSDEGYLTHTLPVTPHQLLVSKLLVGGLWTLIIELAMCLCIFVLVATFSTSVSDANIIAEILEEIDFRRADMGILIHYLAAYGFMLLGGPFSSITTLFGALTIGQLSKKHKGLMGILTYFGISIVSTILTNIIQGIGSMITMSNPYSSIHFTLFFGMDMSLLLNALVAVILYFLSHYIIVRKLNLN